MALPSLTMPSSLPAWRVDGYQAQPEPVYGHAAMATGHTRTRRRWTAATRRETASLRLTDAQLQAWHAWHEDDLQAGLLPFAAQVRNLGPGTVWFDALLLSYTTDSLPTGRTLLQADLLLRGAPSATGPT